MESFDDVERTVVEREDSGVGDGAALLDVSSDENVDRICWALRIYRCVRRDHVPDAPPSVAFLIGFPLSRKAGGVTRLSEVHFECFEPFHSIGGDNVVILHPGAFVDPMVAAAQIALSVIRVSLDPSVKTKKPFRDLAGRMGFLKPWANPEWDDFLRTYLHGLLDEVGFPPEGAYQVPEKKRKEEGEVNAVKVEEKRKKVRVKLFCGCEFPEPIEVTAAQMEAGRLSLLCGHCGKEFGPLAEVGVNWGGESLVEGEVDEGFVVAPM